MPRWTTGSWTTAERELIGKYPKLTARQLKVIFDKKGFSRSQFAISDARTRFGFLSESPNSKRRNPGKRSVFKDAETITDFDFNVLYTRSPCLQCQLREQDKDNYTCGECSYRYHYAQQQHTRWGEDYGQSTREIWDGLQYAFVDSHISGYVSG